ncbi:MAG: PKD domain-containing protein [Chloroflexi bacterium]|nr:PKD domain-containing protein [Chloroflexota bacterium]
MTDRLSRLLSALLSVIVGCLTCWFLFSNIAIQAQPLDPPILGEHCGDVGVLPDPLPISWCGCVWGAVYVDGNPTAGVTVTLIRARDVITFVTTDTYWDQPLYALDGNWIGASYGDAMTVTAAYGGQVVSRTYRAFPNPATLEQQVNLIFPEATGNPPTVISAEVMFPYLGYVQFVAEGIDDDEGGATIVGYEWHSDQDGIIGTEPTVTLPIADLTTAAHTLDLRVQDDEGEWSAPAIRSLPLHLLHPVQVSPLSNGHIAPMTTSIAITYNQSVDPGLVNTQTVVVHARETGRLFESYQVIDGLIRFTPLSPFKPGELVQVSVTTGTRSTSGYGPFRPLVHEFRAGVRGGSGFFARTSFGDLNTRDVAIGDIDGDDDVDMVVVSGPMEGHDSQVWLNNGSGTFTVNQILEIAGDGIELGDLDGDQDLDAFIVVDGPSTNTVWFNDGAGYFSDSGQQLGYSDSEKVALGDVDGDGDLDAFVVNWMGQSNKVWINDGLGYFVDSGQNLFGDRSTIVRLGDLDDDGDLDAFVGNWNTEPNTVWLNDGAGTFVFHQNVRDPLNTDTKDLALGDLDADGDLDVFFANQKGQANEIWLNDGKGNFGNSGQHLGHLGSENVVLGDLDGDGDLDAVVANENHPTTEPYNKVWFNDGNGGFTESIQNLGSGNSRTLSPLSDFDGDGDLDVFVGNEGETNWIWFNTNSYFSISKHASSTALVGKPITFTLRITNSGNVVAANLVITDALPARANYVSGGTLGANNVVSWTVDSLLPKQAVEVVLVVTASAPITNSEYGAFADEGIFAVGQQAVVVDVGTLPEIQSVTVVPGEPAIGEPVIFTAQVTSTTPFTALWEFDSIITSGLTLTHAFNHPGVYPFTLTVDNRYGAVYHSGSVTVTAPRSNWLALLYLDGDNNLSHWMQLALDRLETIPITDSVRVIALIDGSRTNDTYLYEIRTNSHIPLNLDQSWYSTEVDMGQESTLSGFVNWALQSYPADYVYLSIANHGAGVRGISWDRSSDDDYLKPGEIVDFAGGLDSKIDVLHLDACLMGMSELAYLFRDEVDYLVASQNLAWGIFAYDQYLDGAATRSPEELAVHIADTYSVELFNHPHTISVLGLDQMAALNSAVFTFTQALLADDYDAELDAVLSDVQRFDSRNYFVIDKNDEFIDLYDFARLVSETITNSTVHTAAQAVMDLLTVGQPGSAMPPGVVLREHHKSGAYGTRYWDLENSHGLSIYYPADPASPDYGDYAGAPYTFLDDSGWLDLLYHYVKVPQPTVSLPSGPAPTLLYRVFLPLVGRGS